MSGSLERFFRNGWCLWAALSASYAHAGACEQALIQELQRSIAQRQALPLDWTKSLSRASFDDVGEPKDAYARRYFQQVSEAVVDVFLPWFEGKSDLSYEQMHRQMHRVLIFGSSNAKEGEQSVSELWRVMHDQSEYFEKLAAFQNRFSGQVYIGYMNETQPSASLASFAGLTRTQNLALPFPQEALQKIRKWLGSDPSHFRDLERTRGYQFTNRIFSEREIETEMPQGLDRVETESTRSQFNPITYKGSTGTVFSYSFPAPLALKAYYKKAGKILDRIRDERERPWSDSTRDELALYFHVATNAHFFRRVNNAILMAQVNSILISKGLKPMIHGYLDYAAFLLPFEPFKALFKERVESAQK